MTTQIISFQSILLVWRNSHLKKKKKKKKTLNFTSVELSVAMEPKLINDFHIKQKHTVYELLGAYRMTAYMYMVHCRLQFQTTIFGRSPWSLILSKLSDG